MYKNIVVKQLDKKNIQFTTGVDFVALCDVLQITDDYIRQHLVVNRRIDKVIIIEKMVDSQKILQSFPYLTVLPLDASCIISGEDGDLQSKSAYPTNIFSKEPGGSIIYIEANSSVDQVKSQVQQRS